MTLEEMQVFTIVLQLVTVLMTVIVAIISFIATVKSAKISNIAITIANQRLKFLEQYRMLASEIATYCDPISISSNPNFSMMELLSKVNNFKMLFKGVYSEERALIKSVNTLVASVNKYVVSINNIQANSSSEVLQVENLKVDVESNIRDLIELVNIYDLAYWRFIIDQSQGAKYKMDDFDVFYKQAFSEYKSTDENNKT